MSDFYLFFPRFILLIEFFVTISLQHKAFGKQNRKNEFIFMGENCLISLSQERSGLTRSGRV